MMADLREHYDGPGEVNKRHAKAKQRLTELHYQNERVFSWSQFTAELMKCFMIYEKVG